MKNPVNDKDNAKYINETDTYHSFGITLGGTIDDWEQDAPDWHRARVDKDGSFAWMGETGFRVCRNKS